MGEGTPDGRAGRWRLSWQGLLAGGVAGFLGRDLDLPSLVSYWGARAPLVLATALGFALLWGTPLRRALSAAVAALVVAWGLVAFTPLTSLMARDLARRDALAPADAVFVLGSRLQDDGELTTQAMSRLVRAIEVVGQGYAPRLILSELPQPYAPYAPAARALLGHLGPGLAPELLTIGPVRSTRDEARLLGELFRSRGWRRLVVVTDPAHSRRASAAFEAEGLEVVSFPSTETRWDFEDLQRPDERLAAFGSLLHEYAGLAYYRLRGFVR
jgi:uncharacterized SAM-binding protein YcdF (DUF218 family)